MSVRTYRQSIVVLFSVFFFSIYHTVHGQRSFTGGEKQKGAHVFRIVDSTDFQVLNDFNLEWITLVSWGYQDDFDSPFVIHNNGDSASLKKHDEDWIKRIEQVRNAGFKVFFKPHLWLTNPSPGQWRSDIYPSNEENWEIWQRAYRNFILRYAKIAEKAEAEMYCVGMELSRIAVEKPDFWKELIRDIREIYSGKLTYAANWYQEYEQLEFWSDLDFIGVQAYFPLVEIEYPGAIELTIGWQNHLSKLEAIHKKYDRKILFTEMGYKSTADSAIRPWEWLEKSKDLVFSEATQSKCYEAFFQSVWEREWFAGVHIWQIRADYKPRGRENKDFTPQGKPAEEIIARGFE